MASHQPGMRVRLLGRPSAQVGAEIIDFTPDKRYQLLGYLAYHREWISRDRAAYLFWPDTSSALARQNLRGLLQRVRSLGGITGLETTTQHIRWRVDTDVDTLRQAIESGRPGEVITAYSGPLLSGLDDTAAPEYASWVSSERETLHARWREAVFFRSEELTTQGRYPEAEDLLRRVMDADPLDEEVLRRRLRTLSQGGQREAALRLYRHVAAGLAAGWGMEPSDATRQLVQDVESAGEVTERWAPTAPGEKGTFEGEASFLSETEGLFAGREVDLAEVQHLLTTPTCRLLTLVGPGGVGKTRLAWQAAWEQRRRGSRDVYVVPLEAVTSREAMTAHIATVLGLQLEGGEDPLVQITRHLHGRSVMLVLDNFEHLLAHVDVASALLAGCPGLILLMTSRERLNVRHEWLYALDGLPCPPENVEPANVLKYGAAQLLLHEARRINPRFELHDLDVPHVVQVCHLTQGLPLALELAATWLRVLKLSDVVEEIKSALDFLSGGRRDAGARHASMRAVFEHSWSLLSRSEQTTLRNLAVFRGGFTKTAAAEVAGASLADLAALVDKSLLRVSSGGRYDRHPLLYQFTLEKLGEHPEELRVARERHGAFYLQLLTEFGSVWDRHPKAAIDTLALELENVRALNWAVPARASHDELRVAVAALGIYFDMCGQYRAGLELFDRLSHLWEPHGQAGELTAQVWCGSAWLSGRLGLMSQARRFTLKVGQLSEAGWSPWIKMGWLFTLGGLDSLKQDSEHARECFAEALLWADTAGDSRWRTFILNHLARIEMTLGYWEQARLHLDCALAINRKEQNLGLIVYCMLGKGALAVGTDPPEEARVVLLEGLQLAREAGYVLHVPEFLLNLADVCLRLADLEDALGFADEARQLAVASGMKMQECQALVLLGRIAAAGNDQEGACTYWREGWSLARLVGVDPMVTILEELLAKGQCHPGVRGRDGPAPA